MGGLPRIARVIMQLCAFGLALVIIAWGLGRIVSDRYAWSQWLLWIPTPVAITAALVGILLALRPCRRPHWRMRRIIVGCAIFGLILIYFSFIEHRFLASAPSLPGEGLKLVHWNVSAPPTGDTSFMEPVIAMNADVTILTHAGHGRWGREVVAWLGEDHPPRRIGPFSVITRLPVRELRVVVAADDIWIATLTVDAPAPFNRPLTLLLVDLPSDPNLSRIEFAARAHRLLMERNERAPDIALGDFNLTRTSAALRAFLPGMDHAFAQAGHGYGATFPRERPVYHIDHILLSDAMQCTRYDIIDPGIGRHRAQVAWLMPAQ